MRVRTALRYTCTGGTIPAGNYGNVTVAGICSLPDTGTVNVGQSITVNEGAVLDGIKMSTLRVGGSVNIAEGRRRGAGLCGGRRL